MGPRSSGFPQLARGQEIAGLGQRAIDFGARVDRRDEAGDDAVRRDAVAGQTERQDTGQLDDAALGAAVHVDVAAAAQTEARGHVDDLALAGVGHGLCLAAARAQ